MVHLLPVLLSAPKTPAPANCGSSKCNSSLSVDWTEEGGVLCSTQRALWGDGEVGSGSGGCAAGHSENVWSQNIRLCLIMIHPVTDLSLSGDALGPSHRPVCRNSYGIVFPFAAAFFKNNDNPCDNYGPVCEWKSCLYVCKLPNRERKMDFKKQLMNNNICDLWSLM